MPINRIKNTNSNVSKLNSSYVSASSLTVSSAGPGSYEIRGFKKTGINNNGLQVDIIAAAGQGGYGSPRGGNCGGGGGGGGGAALFRYSTNKFGSISYDVGGSGTPIGGTDEYGPAPPAGSGSPTSVLGYSFGSGGNGGYSATGKFGNPGEPPCICGGGGSGGGGGSIPASVVVENSNKPTSIAFIPASGNGAGSCSNASASGAPGAYDSRIQPLGPFPVNAPGSWQPSGFVVFKPKR